MVAKKQKLIFSCLLISLIFLSSALTPTTTSHPTRQLPILMYHKVALDHPAKYVVTVQQLEQDFQALIAAGYTPVFMQEVINWVDGNGALPDKPIVISFDDGQYNNLHYVLPLAQKYGIKYLINPVTAYSEKSIRDHDTDNPRYSNLSWDAIQRGYASGLVEFGNHSHDLHRTSPRFGVAQKANESLAAYRATLTADINHAQALLTNCGIPRPQVFAYPFGKYSKNTAPILLELGFRALLTCTERINVLKQGRPECLHALGRFNRSGHEHTAQILKKLSS